MDLIKPRRNKKNYSVDNLVGVREILIMLNDLLLIDKKIPCRAGSLPFAGPRKSPILVVKGA